TVSRLTDIPARQYGPTIARWVSRDPLLFISAPFPYIYVANRPLVAIDPSGAVFIKKNDFHNETCGRYTWTATFGFDPGEDHGFVIQHVQISVKSIFCDSKK